MLSSRLSLELRIDRVDKTTRLPESTSLGGEGESKGGKLGGTCVRMRALDGKFGFCSMRSPFLESRGRDQGMLAGPERPNLAPVSAIFSSTLVVETGWPLERRPVAYQSDGPAIEAPQVAPKSCIWWVQWVPAVSPRDTGEFLRC